MSKNILVLTGSPRNDGNSDLLAAAFIEGATSAGHNIQIFEAGKSNISGCRACDTCYSKGTPCSFPDDFNKLVPLMQWADSIVIVTPLYWYTFPAQLKAALDKMYSFIIGQKEISIKESYLIVCGEIKEEAVFRGIIESYNCIANDRAWTNKGSYIIPGVVNKGDVLQTDAIKKVTFLGQNF